MKQSPPHKIDKVEAPIAMSIRTQGGQPKITTGRNMVIISHTEYIQDLATTDQNLRVIKIPINPGLPASFPWLNLLAAGYESYKIKSFRARYLPSVATTLAGYVIMAFDFDPSDNNPTDKVSMMQYDGAVRSPIWSPINMNMKTSNLKFKDRYIRYGNLPTGQDIKFYDAANLFVGIQTPIGANVVGELHYDYEIELLTPQFDLTSYAFSTSAKITTNQNYFSTASTGLLGLPNVNPPLITITGGLNITLDAAGGINLGTVGQFIITVIYSVSGTWTGTPQLSPNATAGWTVSYQTGLLATATRIYFSAVINITSLTHVIAYANSFTAVGALTLAEVRFGYYASSLQ